MCSRELESASMRRAEGCLGMQTKRPLHALPQLVVLLFVIALFHLVLRKLLWGEHYPWPGRPFQELVEEFHFLGWLVGQYPTVALCVVLGSIAALAALYRKSSPVPVVISALESA
jgi:hypothetical protein